MLKSLSSNSDWPFLHSEKMKCASENPYLAQRTEMGLFVALTWIDHCFLALAKIKCHIDRPSVKLKVWVTQSCPTLCDPMDYSPPGSSVYGDSPDKSTGVGCHVLLQGISQSRDQTQVSCTAGRFFTIWTTEAPAKMRPWMEPSILKTSPGATSGSPLYGHSRAEL